MEQDKSLQKILLIGAEKASMDFTETVMKKVTELSASPLQYQPLVSHTLKKTFLVMVGILAALILLLGLLISSPSLPVVNMAAIRMVTTYIYENYTRILAFVISFWIVFLTKSLFEKKLNRSTLQ